jgi:hypothetical protein
VGRGTAGGVRPRARGQARPPGRATRAQPPGHDRGVGARDGAGSAGQGRVGAGPGRSRARGPRGGARAEGGVSLGRGARASRGRRREREGEREKGRGGKKLTFGDPNPAITVSKTLGHHGEREVEEVEGGYCAGEIK